MIPFNIPPIVNKELDYISQAIASRKISGDGHFTTKCNQWVESNFKCKKALLTTSCTHALEMAAILIDINAGDEVIMPSYTFVSTANAFVLRGAKIIFVDIRPDTMNIDEKKIEAAITARTKVLVPVHYAGVSCDMETILAIASKYNLYIIEDAAQGVMAKYNERYLGTIGHLGAYSFHESKNYSCGEGGALLINDEKFIERAEIIREKGTNRSRFFRGEVDKYTWVDVGSSYLPSELNAAFLYAQFESAELINNDRLRTWNLYYSLLTPLMEKGLIELPSVPEGCAHNGHMFYVKCRDNDERHMLIDHLKKSEIMSVFHYVPLHSSPAGKRFGRFHGEDRYTTAESERLLRLPMWYGFLNINVIQVCDSIIEYYSEGR